MNYNDQQQAQQNVKSAETDRVMDNKTDTNNMNRNNYSYLSSNQDCKNRMKAILVHLGYM